MIDIRSVVKSTECAALNTIQSWLHEVDLLKSNPAADLDIA